MWEAIRDNRRRSVVLISCMGIILVLLGFLIGYIVYKENGWVGGGIGAAAALALWGIQLIVAFSGGDKIVLMSAKARKIAKADAPQLWNVIEEMTIASGLNKMPAVYIIDNQAPNAFATGLKPEKSAVAVTSGLLRRLNRDEIQGVMAHEIGHIVNQDVRFMTVAMVMVGTIVILSDILIRVFFFGGGRRSSKKGGGGWVIVIALVAAVLAPIFAQLLYFACSRKREYLADASAARYTRYPEGLASALEKISGGVNRNDKASKALAPLYIINPLQSGFSLSLFSTHPNTKERIKILRNMGGAGYGDYQRAYAELTKDSSAIMAGATVQKAFHLDKREGSSNEENRQDQISRAQEAMDILDRGANFMLLACACGVRIKIPPEFKRKAIDCPRCGTKNELPEAMVIGSVVGDALKQAKQKSPTPTAGTPPPANGNLAYKRRGSGWESFKCSCGCTVNLSPAFTGSQAICGKCQRRIQIS